MSSDFYYKKLKTTLTELEILVKFDVDYQVTKAHDQTESQAVERLTAVLGRYMAVYNDAIECVQQNLQVQKTMYLKKIVQAIASRILELKHELQKLEGSSFQFFGYGLIEHLLTVDDIEINEIPEKIVRAKDVDCAIHDVLQRAKEKKEALANPVVIEEVQEHVDNWWDKDEDDETESIVEVKVEEPEDVRKTRDMVSLLQAHEKSRQTIEQLIRCKQKRVKWEKILSGTLKPEARYEIRARSAEIIGKVFRTYFEIKRNKIKQCKRDEMLGIHFCRTPKREAQYKAKEMLENRAKRHDIYEAECNARSEEFKKTFLERRRDALIEDYRDQIRDWFSEWFERILFIHEIPNEGSVAIFKGEVPDPEEWLEEYKKNQLEKQAIKTKSSAQKKLEKMEAKKTLMILKREEKMKNKAEELLMRKIMKNPTMHPGYYYPQSKKTDHILQVIQEYHRSWDQYDTTGALDVKNKYIDDIIVENSIMEAKLEVLPVADQQMEDELKKLKTALKEDYTKNGMKMPEVPKKRKKKTKNKKKVKNIFNQQIIDKIEDLAMKGFIKEYPKTKLEDFYGDPNFAGEDLRCQLQQAHPFNGEIRAFWWEICQGLVHGFHKILLVGPKGGGKTRLVHALASINDAVLFELDPIEVQGDFFSAAYLQQIVQSVAVCAKATQPCVIHIKHVEKLFYRKVPPVEAEMSFDMIKNFFVQKLLKKFKKTDNITVVGTCVDPWVTKSKLLKQFPTILLLPNTSYSMVSQILNHWKARHNVIPYDFNVSSLAYVLQGYSFGYLQEALEKFLTADRIAHIAAYGLNTINVYDFILEDCSETKTEYDQYKKWYFEKTTAGIKESKHLEGRKEFQMALEKYAEKNKKKKAAVSKTRSKFILY